MKNKFIIVMILLSNFITSQVGINTEEPHLSSMLDITSQNAGILIPRMTSDQKQNIPDPADGLMIYDLTEKCLNVYNDKLWQNVCGTVQKSQAVISDCDGILIQGTYMVSASLDLSNYIVIPVSIHVAGTITIVVTSENGYSFNYYSPFVDIGNYNLIVQGVGVPLANITDTLIITINDIQQDCFPVNTVINNPGESPFTVNCNSAKIYGRYTTGIPVKGTEYMTVEITNTSSAESSPYVLRTNIVDGVYFFAAGTIAKGAVTIVTMVAVGTPLGSGVKSFTLTSNSTIETVNCIVEVEFTTVMPSVVIKGAGWGAYNPTDITNGAARIIVNSTANFGVKGITPVEGLTFVNMGLIPLTSTLGTHLQSADIVVVGYDYTPNDDSIDLLTDFVVNKKGVLLYANQSNNSVNSKLINKIFGNGANVTGSNTSTVSYLAPLSGDSNDIFLNGPYGDIINKNGDKYLGIDAKNAMYFSNLPEEAIILSTRQDDSSQVLTFRHPTLGFLVHGDGGWLNGSSATHKESSPVKQENGKPIAKLYNGNVMVYNSILFANALDWAIRYVAENKY